MSGLEIERKFLVKAGADFKSQAYDSSRIKQGYIASGHGRTVRVRTRGPSAYLTIKGPSADGGLSRYEFEKEITMDEAGQLFRLCEPGIIDKTRYLVKSGNHTFEVDEFYGENEGLVMAEVELSSPDEPYKKPDFIGQEVTGDRRFYNSHLRLNPFRLWRDSLSKATL
jgi:CYTH domain-containing protein